MKRWLDRILGQMSRMSRSLSQWQVRNRNKALLLEMDDRLLRDIGLTRGDIGRLYSRKQSLPAHERDRVGEEQNAQS